MPKPAVIPSYRLHKASGQAIVRLNARIFYLGLWNSPASREAYDRHIAEWLARQRQPPPPVETAVPSAKLLVFELIAAYWTAAELHYRKPDGSPTGELQPLRDALRLLRKLYGTTPAEEFGPLKLHACREEMILRDWARSTINSQTKRIVRLFRWAVSRELLSPSVPAALRELPGLERGRSAARETEPIQPLADSDFQATLPHLPPVVADLLRLQRLTGMRPNEVCQLRPGDLDRSGEIWLFTPRIHKTSHRGRARIIALGPKAQQILRPYLLRAADELCFSPAESERQRRQDLHDRRKTPLHHGNRPGSNVKPEPRRKAGQAYNATSLRVAIRRACLKAGVAAWSANQLRHALATDVRAQFGLEAAQVTLGHASASVTQVYAERDLRKALEVARQLG